VSLVDLVFSILQASIFDTYWGDQTAKEIRQSASGIVECFDRFSFPSCVFPDIQSPPSIFHGQIGEYPSSKKKPRVEDNPSLSTHQPPTCHYPPHDLQPSQIKLSKLAGIDRPIEDLQPSTSMTSISHVFLLTDFLTSIKVAAKQALKKTL
jgi:hypothetical protein